MGLPPEEVLAPVDAGLSPGRIGRVVWDTDTRMPDSTPTNSRTRLVLPAPEGAETTKRIPDSDMASLPYSTFCTCSRICSMSTLRSTAAFVVSVSADFDPRVLASRLMDHRRRAGHCRLV